MDPVDNAQATKPTSMEMPVRAKGINTSSQPQVSPSGSSGEPAVPSGSTLPPLGLSPEGITAGGPRSHSSASSTHSIPRDPDPLDEAQETLNAALPVWAALQEGGRSSPTRSAAAEASGRREDDMQIVVHSSTMTREAEQISRLTAGVRPGEASGLNVDEQTAYLQNLASHRTALALGAMALVEFVAKAIVSGIHFGIVQTFMLKLADMLLEQYHITDPVARATVQAVVVGPALATAHHVAETVIRTSVIAAAPRRQVPTDPAKALGEGPRSQALTKQMKLQQEAAKPGQPVGGFIGLLAFMVAAGGAKALISNEDLASIVGSVFGGGLMALGHSLVNAAARVKDGDQNVFSFDVAGSKPGESAMDRVQAAVPKAIKGTLGSVSPEGKAIPPHTIMEFTRNLFHEIGVARNLGLTQGEFIKQWIAAGNTENPTRTQKYKEGSVGPLAILGLGFFPVSTDQGLGKNRGNTAEMFGATRKALKGLDPRTAAGTTHALLGTDKDGAWASVQNLLTHVVDGTHQTVSSANRVPMSLVTDMVKLLPDAYHLMASDSSSAPAAASSSV